MIDADRRNRDARVPGWTHGIGTMLDAVRGAGLELTGFTDHDVCPWRRWPDLRDLGDGWWTWPERAPRLPLMFPLRATKS